MFRFMLGFCVAAYILSVSATKAIDHIVAEATYKFERAVEELVR